VNSVARILLEQIVFLATASDEEVHPDVAIAQLEAVTFGVRSLPEPDRAIVDKVLQTMLREVEPGGEAHHALQEFAQML
jgi:hypothetical protein